MRIAIVNALSTRAGGIETYLDSVIPALNRAGHEIAFFSQFESLPEQERIYLPAEAPHWCTGQIGIERALAELSAWRPTVIYVHAISDSSVEARIITNAPAVLYAHVYYGTCISGNKMFAFPRPRPCHLRFGWRCLLHYYPHRCGGLNPLTMWTRYSNETSRLSLMNRYAAILTASTHMREEYLKHGFPPSLIHTVPYPVVPGSDAAAIAFVASSGNDAPSDQVQLLFAGRMTSLKGGQIMLDALPAVEEALQRPVRAIFVGDGPARQEWEEQARRISDAQRGDLILEFTGWLDAARLNRLRLDCDLLVVPSLWPEPFGLVGPEAGLQGLPAAAFAVGGIPDWLTDGLNGYLAPGDPPTAAGLAQAIIKCLREPAGLIRLSAGARERASTFGCDRHINALLAILSEAAHPTAPDHY
jgi:glycosyltransferase involved in cell wall biosynthesis